MSRWKLACGLVVVTVLACVGATMAQEGRRAGGGQGRWDPEQMRQMMMDRVKESLGATDEEWTVIGPRYETVTTLARDARGGGMFGRRGGFGGRGGRGGPGGEAAEAPQSETAKPRFST